MDKIRITKDENGAVILRFEKREDCEKYTVYFRRENGRFKFLITTEKTAVRVNAVEGLCYFRITGQTSGGRTVNIGTVDTSSLMKRTGFITMGSYNVQKIVERSPKFTADNTVRKISPLAAFFPEKIDNSDAQVESRTFEYIKENRSDYFIFDFYGTAVHGLVKTENSFLTGGIDGNEKHGEKLPNILPEEAACRYFCKRDIKAVSCGENHSCKDDFSRILRNRQTGQKKHAEEQAERIP